MALATQCPHCQTTFRVAHDQLKLRAGLVRCGFCKEIFNGIEHLLPPEDAARPPESAPTPIPSGTPEVAPHDSVENPPSAPAESASAFAKEYDFNAVSDEAAAEPQPPIKIDFDIPADFERETASSEPSEEIKREDPLQRMTLLDFTRDLPDSIDGDQKKKTERAFSNAEESNVGFDSDTPDELDAAIENLQRKPWRGARKSKARAKEDDALDAVDTEDEPSFLKRGRRKQQMGPKLRTLLGVSCFILFIAALLQGGYLFRNQIAGLFPQSKAVLTQMCDVLGCRIDLPAQIAAVSIESSELQTLAANKDTFVLTTLLRNYSNTLQEWPHIELTLNDANEKPLLRRVFKPADYLVSTTEVRSGFAATSERTVKLSFELAQVKASGYRVYLFYP